MPEAKTARNSLKYYALYLIKGSFHIFNPDDPHNGPEPDGDTIKFHPDNRLLIDKLPKANLPAKFNLAGLTSIRFEGIDALETHFTIEGDTFHQKLNLALQAKDVLLDKMGFGKITFFNNAPYKVESVEHHPVQGYIFSNGLDTYGRTIAFVFIGEHQSIDGSKIFITPDMLDESLNVYMLRIGQPYGAFYLSLPADLRDYLFDIVSDARKSGGGIWNEDTVSTFKSTEIAGLEELQQLVLWPKLFRRLAAYFQSGYTSLSMLDSWLRADPKDRDDRLIFPNRELGRKHDLIITEEDRVHLSFLPEEVVIVPDDYQLPSPTLPPVPQPEKTKGAVSIVAALINPIGNEQGKETVTMHNTTNTAIDLTGWYIADQSGRQALQGIIEKGEALRIKLGNTVRLSNIRDTITIVNHQGDIISQVSYEKRSLPEEGYTIVF